MAEREGERTWLGDGVSIYREYETWMVEVRWRGERRRWSLKTRDRGGAVMKAGNILRELKVREEAIERDFLTLVAEPGFDVDGSLAPVNLFLNPAAMRLRDLSLE